VGIIHGDNRDHPIGVGTNDSSSTQADKESFLVLHKCVTNESRFIVSDNDTYIDNKLIKDKENDTIWRTENLRGSHYSVLVSLKIPHNQE